MAPSRREVFFPSGDTELAKCSCPWQDGHEKMVQAGSNRQPRPGAGGLALESLAPANLDGQAAAAASQHENHAAQVPGARGQDLAGTILGWPARGPAGDKPERDTLRDGLRQ